MLQKTTKILTFPDSDTRFPDYSWLLAKSLFVLTSGPPNADFSWPHEPCFYYKIDHRLKNKSLKYNFSFHSAYSTSFRKIWPPLKNKTFYLHTVLHAWNIPLTITYSNLDPAILKNKFRSSIFFGERWSLPTKNLKFIITICLKGILYFFQYAQKNVHIFFSKVFKFIYYC